MTTFLVKNAIGDITLLSVNDWDIPITTVGDLKIMYQKLVSIDIHIDRLSLFQQIGDDMEELYPNEKKLSKFKFGKDVSLFGLYRENYISPDMFPLSEQIGSDQVMGACCLTQSNLSSWIDRPSYFTLKIECDLLSISIESTLSNGEEMTVASYRAPPRLYFNQHIYTEHILFKFDPTNRSLYAVKLFKEIAEHLYYKKRFFSGRNYDQRVFNEKFYTSVSSSPPFPENINMTGFRICCKSLGGRLSITESSREEVSKIDNICQVFK